MSTMKMGMDIDVSNLPISSSFDGEISILLQNVDPTKNVKKFYSITMTPLKKDTKKYAVKLGYGRIGNNGVETTRYSSLSIQPALGYCVSIAMSKCAKGYKIVREINLPLSLLSNSLPSWRVYQYSKLARGQITW